MTPPNMVIISLIMRDMQIKTPINILVKSLINTDIIRLLELTSRTSRFEDANLLCHQIWLQLMTIYGQNIQSFSKTFFYRKNGTVIT